MPYMGSKRKLSSKIVNFILKENPNTKYVYDLFGGGGAMSFEFLQQSQIKQVTYNELNTGVVRLLEDIRVNGITEKYYKWIDRETFNKNKNKNTWLGGLCKVVWSFGNNQKSYLFGKDTKKDKRLLHEIVVNKCVESLNIFNTKHNTALEMDDKKSFFEEGITQRRLRIMRGIKDRKGELQQLERLEQLEQLERLEQLEQLQITNLSYLDVKINTPINETIIYLDPPYQNTEKYEKDICHDELYEYIKNSPYKIYMSSYESNLECVLEIEHTSSLSATANNKVAEKLFTNFKGKVI